MPTWITGVVTGGFSFLSEWWKGKQEQAKQELSIKQETVRVKNELKLKQVVAQLDEDGERVKQMAKSFKDEWFMILFSIPLINMFISPFVDLFFLDSYQDGMLATAASEALQNLDKAPMWYTAIIIMMTCLSWGYRRGIDGILNIITRGGWSKYNKQEKK